MENMKDTKSAYSVSSRKGQATNLKQSLPVQPLSRSISIEAEAKPVEEVSSRLRQYKNEPSGAEIYLDFSPQSFLNGVILSEVLGKPKALRKGRL